MEIHLSTDMAAKLTQSAAQKGRDPDQCAQDVLARYLEDEDRFIEAVERGEAALKSGDFLTHEQVGKRLERFLRG